MARVGCGICKMPVTIREEIEGLIKDGQVSIRKIGERYNVGPNVVMKHSHTCMERAPTDAQSKLKEMARLLEEKGDYKSAATVYGQIVNSCSEDEREGVFEYLGRIAPRLCPDCRAVILGQK